MTRDWTLLRPPPPSCQTHRKLCKLLSHPPHRALTDFPACIAHRWFGGLQVTSSSQNILSYYLSLSVGVTGVLGPGNVYGQIKQDACHSVANGNSLFGSKLRLDWRLFVVGYHIQVRQCELGLGFYLGLDLGFYL